MRDYADFVENIFLTLNELTCVPFDLPLFLLRKGDISVSVPATWTVKGVSVENVVDNSFVGRGELKSRSVSIVDEIEVVV